MDWTSTLLTIFGTGGIGFAIIAHILNRRKYNAEAYDQETTAHAKEVNTATELHDAAVASALKLLEVMRTEKESKDLELQTLEQEYCKIETEIGALQDKLHELVDSIDHLQDENDGLRRSLVTTQQMLRMLDPIGHSGPISEVEGFTHTAYSDSFFMASLMPVAYVSQEGTFIESNSRWRDMLGYTHEEHMLMTWKDVTHDDDHASEGTMYRVLTDNNKIEHYTIRKRFVSKDGTTFWRNLYVRPIWINSRFRHFVEFAVPVAKDVATDN